MLRNCTKCNRVFAHPTQRLCPECQKARQEEYTKVKEYLTDFPKARVIEVSEATEVSTETIYEFIREGRLNVVPSDVELVCDVCQIPIKTGRLCQNCRDRLQHGNKGEAKLTEGQTREGRVHLWEKIRGKDRD